MLIRRYPARPARGGRASTQRRRAADIGIITRRNNRAREPIMLAIERALAWALVLGLGGCASGVSTDLARLRSLTDMPLPDRLGEVDPAPAPEVEQLLVGPLDVDTAVRVAVLNNRELRATLRELGVERGMLIDARSVANPTLEFEVLPERDTSYELRVEYEISSLILAPLRAKVARSALDEARYRAAVELVVLGYRVRAAFRELQSAGDRLAVGQRRLDAFAASRDAAVALGDAGAFNDLEAATQIVSYERARLEVGNLELELSGRRERLHRLLGLHAEHTAWTIDASLPALPDGLPTIDDLENVALTASLELAASRSELEAIAQQTGLARTEGWLPEIAVDYHALVGNPDPADSNGALRSGAGVSLSVPLFNQNRGQTRAAEAKFDAQLERHIGASVDIRSAAREVANHLRATHAAARHLGEVVLPAQRRVLDQTLLQYNAMQVGVFELLAAERAVLEVELAEIDARAAFWTAHAAYHALLAGARVPGEAMSDGNGDH
jgi:outer membrane protein, heavy metal efflux system